MPRSADNATNDCPVFVMTPRQRETLPPATLGQIRGHGCRNLLVYCESLWCNHSAVMNADGLPDEMPVRSLCPRMVWTACGLVPSRRNRLLLTLLHDLDLMPVVTDQERNGISLCSV